MNCLRSAKRTLTAVDWFPNSVGSNGSAAACQTQAAVRGQAQQALMAGAHPLTKELTTVDLLSPILDAVF